MSHQVFVDKMLSVLSTPMLFLEESSFVFASNGRRLHWCLCSRGALTASLFARSKQEHPTQNKNTRPNEDTPPNEGVWKIFVKFAGITGLRKKVNRIKKI